MSPPVGGIRAHRQAAHEPRGSTHQRQLRLARAAGSGSEGARKGKSMARSARRPGRQAQVTGLLLALLLVGAWEASGGCASIGGIVLKWIEQTILARALIEAVPLPDTVGYLTLADSGGQFNLQNLAPGRYIVYATSDDNGDRRRSPREAYDSTLVTLDSSSNVALLAFPHDTIAPRPRGATYVDSITVRGDFSQALDPTAPLDTAHVHVLQLPDSTPVAVAQILTQQQYDSLTNAVRQKAESAGAAAIKHDTAAAPNTPPTAPPGPPAPAAPPPAPPPPPPPPPPPSPVQPAGRGRGAAARPSRQPVDTALVRKLLAQRPVPSDKIVIRLLHPLNPETRYVVRIESAMNLSGKKGGGDIGCTVPKPVPVDTTRRAPRAIPKPPPPPPP